MRVRPGLLAILGAVGASACAFPGSNQVQACTSDAQCRAGQLCFAEGCGDPGTGIVVEVSGGALSGQYPQDVSVPDGTLGASRDFDLGGGLGLAGTFQRELSATPDAGHRVTYPGTVVLKAVGQSELLPGVSRYYEQRVDPTADGAWSMSLGAGRYALTAVPADLAVPPASATDQAARPDGAAPDIAFVFPAQDGALPVSGRLLDLVDRSLQPAQEQAITRGTMDLQAFDPATLLPLSQRFPVSSGQPGSNGNFAMTLKPEARALPAIIFRATPRDSSAILPTKDFLVETPLPDPLTLELGGPGPPLTLRGRVLDPDGLPLAGAQVVSSGVVVGGGSYRSRVALTDASGDFELVTLEGRDLISLTVIPPAGSPAAVTTRWLLLYPGLSPEVSCERRVRVAGTVLTPTGLPAGGVQVRASPHDPGGEPRPVPLETSTSVADPTGSFQVLLDPGTWRLEFSGPGLPTLSRLVTVPSPLDGLGLPIYSYVLPSAIHLSPGRTISGTVTGTRGGRAGVPIPWATARFFRVGPIDGVPTAILLGSAVADDKGHYSVVLPGR